MNKVLMSLVLLLSTVLALPASALGTPTHTPDDYYELDTWGSNSDVYEFTPTGAPWKLCILYLTDMELRPQMHCENKVSDEVVELWRDDLYKDVGTKYKKMIK